MKDIQANNALRKRADGKTVCACGRRKNPKGLQCHQCRWGIWSAEDVETLIRLHGEGLPYKAIAEALERPEGQLGHQIRKLGLKRTWEQHQANRVAAVKAYFQDPEKLKEWLARPVSETTREKRSARARERNLAGEFGVAGNGHSEETKRKIREANFARADKRLDFAPRGHPLRRLYYDLIYRKKLSASEALEIVRERAGGTIK